MPETAEIARFDPLRLTIADAARLLARVGGRRLDEDVIRADVEDGAPTNADGTLNLVHYAAWLTREVPVGD